MLRVGVRRIGYGLNHNVLILSQMFRSKTSYNRESKCAIPGPDRRLELTFSFLAWLTMDKYRDSQEMQKTTLLSSIPLKVIFLERKIFRRGTADSL